jgi:hypothetical protein
MIDFSKYVGKHVKIVTNFTDSPELLFGIRDDILGIELFTINGRYVCASILTAEDLKDEDFVQWLNTMWPSEPLLINFLKMKSKWYPKKEKIIKKSK